MVQPLDSWLLERSGSSQTPVDIQDSTAPSPEQVVAGNPTNWADAERVQQLRLAFLAEASTLLASSLDYTTTLTSLARLAVPRLADWCAVDVVEKDQSVRRLTMTHLDPNRIETAAELHRRFPAEPDPVVHRVIRSGQSEFYPEVTGAVLSDYARNPEQLEVVRQLGMKSAMVVPLLAGGRTLGTITFVLTQESERRYGADELVLAEDLAHRVATAVDNARLYEEVQEAVRERDSALEKLEARVRQQAAVAELGRRALTASDLSRLFEEMVCLVAETLKVEYCELLEFLPGKNKLLLRAGSGWKPGYVGQLTVGMEPNSQAGYTIRRTDPVIVDDIRTETRFKCPKLLASHGVISGMTVVIRGREAPFAVLGAHSRRRLTFSRDDTHFFHAVANVLESAIERDRMQTELRSLSLTDELTGLLNRRGFLTLAQQHQKLAHRMRKGLLLAYGDLDGLKNINDTYGHHHGDLALIHVARILKDTFRDSDILARLGGDEFTVLVMDDSTARSSTIRARLQQRLHKYNSSREQPYQLSLSVGVARFDRNQNLSVEEMLLRADEALYRSKRRKQRHEVA
ncbi:MAG TPA: diguanylate cyclase [Acidobacteriota bacterium]|jgi:diguanylate cyclase (GGDEF)-like protein